VSEPSESLPGEVEGTPARTGSGRSSLDLYSRPFLEQCDGGGVIQIFVPVLGGQFVHFFHGSRAGSLTRTSLAASSASRMSCA